MREVRTQTVITYTTGTADRAVAEGFLQRCAFDDTTSLDADGVGAGPR